MAERAQLHEEERYFDAGGIRLHVRTWSVEAGTAPPLVIVHGVDESWRTFQALGPRLAQNRTVYAVDLRGHGESDKPETGFLMRMWRWCGRF